MVAVTLKQALGFSLTHLSKALQGFKKCYFQAVDHFYAKSPGENPTNSHKEFHSVPCYSANS